MTQLSLEEKIYVFQNRIYILNKLWELVRKNEMMDEALIDPYGIDLVNQFDINSSYLRSQNNIQDIRPFADILLETDRLWADIKQQFSKIVKFTSDDLDQMSEMS